MRWVALTIYIAGQGLGCGSAPGGTAVRDAVPRGASPCIWLLCVLVRDMGFVWANRECGALAGDCY